MLHLWQIMLNRFIEKLYREKYFHRRDEKHQAKLQTTASKMHKCIASVKNALQQLIKKLFLDPRVCFDSSHTP